MRSRLTAVLALGLIVALQACMAQGGLPDADGDFISDEAEAVLGSNPRVTEQFKLVLASPLKELRPGGAQIESRFDIDEVWLANCGPGQWLWAVTLADDYNLDRSSVQIYLDTDDNPGTGYVESPTTRGIDVILRQRGRSVYRQEYDKAGHAPPLAYQRNNDRVVVENGILYLSTSLDLIQHEDGSHFRMLIACGYPSPWTVRDIVYMSECIGPPDRLHDTAIGAADRTGNLTGTKEHAAE